MMVSTCGVTQLLGLLGKVLCIANEANSRMAVFFHSWCKHTVLVRSGFDYLVLLSSLSILRRLGSLFLLRISPPSPLRSMIL